MAAPHAPVEAGPTDRPACGPQGADNIAQALISFPSLAAYEAYRTRLRADPAGAANFAEAQAKRFILSEERTFLRRVEP